jgi:outer membrane protein assembly factor BamB
MVVSNGLTLRVLHPAKGSSVRTTDLSRPTAGGSKDGLRAGLKRSTMLQSLGDGRVLVTRRDGGEIQCLDPFEGEVVWKYAPDGALSRRVLELPVAGKRLLVPLGYPDPRRVTVLTEWGAELDGSKPLWTTELDGKTNGRRVWLFGDEIVARLEGPAGRQFLARLDADSGRLLSKAHIPAVKECMPGWSRNLYCRSGGQVLAFDPRTGRRLWHQGVGTGRDRLHRIWAFDKWVAAVTANRIWLIEADTGRAAWRIGKVFKTSQGDKVRALVSDVLGEVGGRVLLVLNGRVVEKDHRRIFLAAVGLGKGKPEYLTRLGPPGPSRRARRVGHGYEQLDVPVKLASRAGDEVVFSAVGLYSRLIDPKTGARIKDSRQPGEKDAPTSLIEATEGVAFLERSDLMTAVDMTTLETLWKLPVPDLEPTHFGPEGVFLTNGKGKVVWMTRAGRKKLSAPAEETVAEQRAVVQHAGSKGLAIRVGDQTHFVEKSTGEVTVKTKRINVFVKKGSRLFGLQRDHRPAEKTGAYVALDVETGKRLWKKEVSRQLSPLPAPVLAERRWPVAWVRGAGDTFVTTDTLGRCVIALQSSDGAVRWTVCFDRLIGPPIAARGYLFVAAEGPARDLRSKKGEPGEAHTGDKDAIHAIRIRDGKSRRVYVPKNEAHIRFGQARPFEDSAGNLFLLAVEAPTRLALKENEIVAISLW